MHDTWKKRTLVPSLWLLFCLICLPSGVRAERPLMKDFMGLCVHTVMFEAETYTPVTGMVRDYHQVNWDIGQETDYVPQWPLARNGVNWDTLYGAWTGLDFDILVSLMYDGIPPDSWLDLALDAEGYAQSFAAYFGSQGQGTVSAVEVGNEPTRWDDEQYRVLFENTARGIRAGDSEMQIATCAAQDGPSSTYAKSLDLLAGLEHLYDIINVHAYAHAEGWPTWRPSYPEDPNIELLTRIRGIIQWRDENAPDKQIWLTEFGWDCSTQEPDPGGDFAQWEDVTDLQQAQYIVRAWLVFATMDIDRAYLYWFKDEDTPQLHGSSGLVRNGVPKPSFHATTHLQTRLGHLRFDRIIREDAGDAYVYAFADPEAPNQAVWVAWSPTGEDREITLTLDMEDWVFHGAEQMATTAGAVMAAPVEEVPEGVRFQLSESPTYLILAREGAGPPDVPEPGDPATDPPSTDDPDTSGSDNGGAESDGTPMGQGPSVPEGTTEPPGVPGPAANDGIDPGMASMEPTGSAELGVPDTAAETPPSDTGCGCTAGQQNTPFPPLLILGCAWGWCRSRRRRA